MVLSGRRTFAIGSGACLAGAASAVTAVSAAEDGKQSLASRSPPGIWNVRDFGARGDGKTDDWRAIQDAVDVVREAGSGVLVIPPSHSAYIISKPVDLALAHHLTLFAYGAILHGLGDFTLSTGRSAKDSFWNLPVVALRGRYAIGSGQLHLAREPELSFSPGEILVVRCGGIVPGSEMATPIAELNEVRRQEGQTITLSWPLAKPFADRDDGMPFGVAAAASRVTRGLRIFGLTANNASRRCFELVV